MLGLPAATLGALGGTFLVPMISNNIAEHEVAYWKLSLVNSVVTIGTAIAVSVGTFDHFKSNQEGGYIAACLLAPIAAGALSTWAMHTFMDKDPAGVASAPANPLIPSVAMVVTPQHQGVLLAFQF